ncbi:MAG: hypothetical protein HY678_08365 [Chloroflexi bacterium]|nr:hypothetical protein [Chloroflexota bacterium]
MSGCLTIRPRSKFQQDGLYEAVLGPRPDQFEVRPYEGRAPASGQVEQRGRPHSQSESLLGRTQLGRGPDHLCDMSRALARVRRSELDQAGAHVFAAVFERFR